MQKDPGAKETEHSLCVLYFVVLVFSHPKQKQNTQQWYQSRLRLFVSDKEAEGRSLLVTVVSCFKYTVKEWPAQALVWVCLTPSSHSLMGRTMIIGQ